MSCPGWSQKSQFPKVPRLEACMCNARFKLDNEIHTIEITRTESRMALKCAESEQQFLGGLSMGTLVYNSFQRR